MAEALPLLDVPSGANISALLLLVCPVGEVAIASLLLPAPLSFKNELELAEALLGTATNLLCLVKSSFTIGQLRSRFG